jgi:hypothetical protein
MLQEFTAPSSSAVRFSDEAEHNPALDVHRAVDIRPRALSFVCEFVDFRVPIGNARR